jgi:hypothetical protein
MFQAVIVFLHGSQRAGNLVHQHDTWEPTDAKRLTIFIGAHDATGSAHLLRQRITAIEELHGPPFLFYVSH